MVELADIFRLHGSEYRERFKDRMLWTHRKVMQDIEECRTEPLGGQVYFCKECREHHYSYHSCKNRHCPKCQNDSAQEWLKNQHDLLLPVTYFMVTVTLPGCFSHLAQGNQEIIYNILFRASAGALQKLALDPKYVGGEIGMVGVLQTWSRDMAYHPHIHYLIPGGGLSHDGNQWWSAREDFFLPVKALSVIFRAKFRDELKKTKLFNKVPADIWKKNWVVHSKPVGCGESTLKYLAPYIFRVAISNNRILKMENGMVTFQYKESDTGKLKIRALSALEFIRRFLQHVLPERFMKVRYYGILNPRKRNLLNKAKELLGVKAEGKEKNAENKEGEKESETKKDEVTLFRCPKCGRVMVIVEEIRPKKRGPPWL